MKDEIKVSAHALHQFIKRGKRAIYSRLAGQIRSQGVKVDDVSFCKFIDGTENHKKWEKELRKAVLPHRKKKPIPDMEFKYALKSNFKPTEYYMYNDLMLVVRENTIVTVMPYNKKEFIEACGSINEKESTK